MNVWVLNHDSYGDVSVWSADIDPRQIPLVKDELSYLVGEYDDELEDFNNDVERAIQRGHGSARIEERFSVELTEVNTL
jgi:hypothetical protein